MSRPMAAAHLVLCALLPIALVPYSFAEAAGFSILHRFVRSSSDGRYPWSSLIADNSGNLYGTTSFGGSTDACGGYRDSGCGTVFRLAPDGSETVLHVFTGQPDGAFPMAGLVADANGNLYGTTASGGASNKGTVFEIAADGTESVLLSFGGKRGVSPETRLIIDGDDNLYGTTAFGGDKNCPERIEPSGCGVVFKVAPDGTETVLHAFTGVGDGNEPLGALVMDASGDLYGTTQFGGLGDGNIFEIAADGTEAVTYTFQGKPDGARPTGDLIIDGAGNLYGTTAFGGNDCQESLYGCGTVFRLDPNGSETVLYAFSEGCCNGIVPYAGVVADAKGNLYGTTLFGGAADCNCGAVFKVGPDGTETALHAFESAEGYESVASLLLVNNELFGTVALGGRCRVCGSVFELQK